MSTVKYQVSLLCCFLSPGPINSKISPCISCLVVQMGAVHPSCLPVSNDQGSSTNQRNHPHSMTMDGYLPVQGVGFMGAATCGPPTGSLHHLPVVWMRMRVSAGYLEGITLVSLRVDDNHRGHPRNQSQFLCWHVSLTKAVLCSPFVSQVRDWAAHNQRVIATAGHSRGESVQVSRVVCIYPLVRQARLVCRHAYALIQTEYGTSVD